MKYIWTVAATIMIQHLLRYLLKRSKANANRVVTDEQIMGRVRYWEK